MLAFFIAEATGIIWLALTAWFFQVAVGSYLIYLTYRLNKRGSELKVLTGMLAGILLITAPCFPIWGG